MTALTLSSALGQKVGQWRAVYWEPVMGSGERLCVGCITGLDGRVRAHKSLKAGVLPALYGAGSAGAESLLDQTFGMINKLSEQLDLGSLVSPMVGVHLGAVETAHVNAELDLIEIALLMSSSVCNLADPGQLDSDEVATDGGKRVNQQFITRIRTHVSTLRPDLAACFNVEAKMLAKRPVRFGFLSDRLVSHLGLLPAANLNAAVRNARGLMTEVRMAHVARDEQGKAGLVIGHASLQSPELNSKERDAIADCVEELRLEAHELNVEFRAADSDAGCASQLMALA